MLQSWTTPGVVVGAHEHRFRTMMTEESSADSLANPIQAPWTGTAA